MKFVLLIGDTIDGTGKALSDVLKTASCNTVRCSNSLPALEAACAEYAPDALIFFITGSSISDVYSFVEKMVFAYPKMKIFVLSYIKSSQMRKQLEKAGITNFFLMPDALNELSKYIIVDLLPAGEQALTLDIMSYLSSLGIPSLNSGYYIMCTAMKLCIREPELMNRITQRLYPRIAAQLDATPESVDQKLRRFSRYKGRYPLNNTRLINAAVKEFTDKYSEYKLPTYTASIFSGISPVIAVE